MNDRTNNRSRYYRSGCDRSGGCDGMVAAPAAIVAAVVAAMNVYVHITIYVDVRIPVYVDVVVDIGSSTAAIALRLERRTTE